MMGLLWLIPITTEQSTLRCRHYAGDAGPFPWMLSGPFSFSKGLVVSPKVWITLSSWGSRLGEEQVELRGLELAKHVFYPRSCCVFYFLCLQCPACAKLAQGMTVLEVGVGSGSYC